ncbi:MAG TPA: ABC transporter permease [Candidatus Pullichristensenella avicola]|nr:ABC transporter permease [Candidatus Pullichristensenella avicola]
MLVESVRMSVSNIRQNRMRSFLTILGIMIGVTAVIALVTTISGVSNSISDSFSSMGASTMTLSATGTDLQGGLTAENMEELSELEHVDGVSPSVSLTATAARDDAYESGVRVSGRNDDYFAQEPDAIARGRAVNAIDLEQSLRVCLISEELVETFFYGDDPIGQELYLNGMRFTVVGVLAEDADSSVSSMLSGSDAVVVPYTTALKMNGETLVSSLTVYIDDANAAEAVESELETALDIIFDYEDDAYSITTMESIADTMESMLSMMSALLGGIASIALLVGGIGIMNMMLTSVTERTVEIGLKKAIGARPGQIQAQFLIESFLLSMVGGLTGVALGIALSAILCQVLGTGFSLSYGAIALGVGFSAAVGVIFGWSPARKASRLNPIDALRRM